MFKKFIIYSIWLISMKKCSLLIPDVHYFFCCNSIFYFFWIVEDLLIHKQPKTHLAQSQQIMFGLNTEILQTNENGDLYDVKASTRVGRLEQKGDAGFRWNALYFFQENNQKKKIFAFLEQKVVGCFSRPNLVRVWLIS